MQSAFRSSRLRGKLEPLKSKNNAYRTRFDFFKKYGLQTGIHRARWAAGPSAESVRRAGF